MDDLWYHGGNINAARAEYPNAPDQWVDLSTGINPVAYPIGAVGDAAWTELPQPGALEAIARVAYGADTGAEVVAAAGSQALIQLLPRLVDSQDVGILGFTYAEHERCWRAAGARVTIVDALSDLAHFQIGVVVNPNNPDGRLCSAARLADVAAALGNRGGMLIVDEAFMDVAEPGFSLAPRAGGLEAVVLRSFGKAYGLAGLRLGFAVTNIRIGKVLREALGPWAVSGPAIEVARRALGDPGWLQASIVRLRLEGARLDMMLNTAGFEILGGTALFRLVRSPRALDWFRVLCQHGILTRPFAARWDQLRLGIPHDAAHWDRLRECLIGFSGIQLNTMPLLVATPGARNP